MQIANGYLPRALLNSPLPPRVRQPRGPQHQHQPANERASSDGCSAAHLGCSGGCSRLHPGFCVHARRTVAGVVKPKLANAKCILFSRHGVVGASLLRHLHPPGWIWRWHHGQTAISRGRTSCLRFLVCYLHFQNGSSLHIMICKKLSASQRNLCLCGLRGDEPTVHVQSFVAASTSGFQPTLFDLYQLRAEAMLPYRDHNRALLVFSADPSAANAHS